MRDSNVRRLSTLHRVLYRLSGGVVGRRLAENDMLLLSTVGRRSGRPHTVPLLYLEEPSGFVVVGSFGGRDRHPDWYLNLVAEPRVQAQIRGSKMSLHARTVSAPERDVLWARVVDAYDRYARYEGRTSREIPIVILEPAADSAGPVNRT